MQLEQTIRTQILEAKGMRLGDFEKVEDAVKLVDIMVRDNCAEFGHALQMVKHSETPILDKFFFIKANGKNKVWRQKERQEIHIEGDFNLEFLTDESLL